MANIMQWRIMGLLVLVLPSLALAAVFNWNRHGETKDNSLRFEPRINGHDGVVVRPQSGHDGIVTRPQTDNVVAPAFCNDLDCPVFRVIKNESTYQLREYVASGWASTTSIGVDYDKASYTDFMRLFDYISGHNAKEQKIPMTAPVLNSIIPGQGPTCADNFTMSFFMSPKEGDPPQPTDETVFLSRLPKMRVYVRSFPGFASKDRWLEEAEKLTEALKGKTYITDFFFTAGYNSPFQLENRHNEIWFIADGQ